MYIFFVITSCTLGAHADHSRYKVWRPKPLPMMLLASLASVTIPCAGPLLFLKLCQTVTLCYQRFTHTATPHLESSVCIVRQTLSRKVLWPTSWQPCMNLAFKYTNGRVRPGQALGGPPASGTG